MSVINEILKRERMTETIVNLRSAIINAAWAVGPYCFDENLDAEEESKDIEVWMCKILNRELLEVKKEHI